MAFDINRFGSNSSNIKSILGGVNDYRYYNKDGNTLTTPGYFPDNLGLEVGDRIRVVPKTKTDADEIYVVSSVVDGVVTVTQIDTDGAVDSVNGKTGHVILNAQDVGALPDSTVIPAAVQYETMPIADASNAGKIVEYVGATDSTYTNGYFYKNQPTPVYTGTVSFNPASISGVTTTCNGDSFATFVGTWGSGNVADIIKGTLTYDQSGGLLVFVGLDDTNTQVCTFQLYTQDYEDAGFVFSGTLSDGDVINFTCTISESAVYAWNRIDVQPTPVIPSPLPSQTGNAGKFLTTDGTDASWGTVESLPSQTGNSGKFLTTDGTDASWSDKPIENLSTDGLIIYGNVTVNSGNSIVLGGKGSGESATNTLANSVVIGPTASSSAQGVVVIGYHAQASNSNAGGATVVGGGAKATQYGIAIGSDAVVSGKRAIQLGGGTNSVANTLKVGLSSSDNYTLLEANGTIPADRLASTSGLADGNYRLRLTMASGVPTLTWVAEQQ